MDLKTILAVPVVSLAFRALLILWVLIPVGLAVHERGPSLFSTMYLVLTTQIFSVLFGSKVERVLADAWPTSNWLKASKGTLWGTIYVALWPWLLVASEISIDFRILDALSFSVLIMAAYFINGYRRVRMYLDKE